MAPAAGRLLAYLAIIVVFGVIWVAVSTDWFTDWPNSWERMHVWFWQFQQGVGAS